jgi:hypothetical protein
MELVQIPTPLTSANAESFVSTHVQAPSSPFSMNAVMTLMLSYGVEFPGAAIKWKTALQAAGNSLFHHRVGFLQYSCQITSAPRPTPHSQPRAPSFNGHSEQTRHVTHLLHQHIHVLHVESTETL